MTQQTKKNIARVRICNHNHHKCCKSWRLPIGSVGKLWDRSRGHEVGHGVGHGVDLGVDHESIMGLVMGSVMRSVMELVIESVLELVSTSS